MSNQAEEIIKSHVIWAIGGGLIPLPIVDFVAVTSIQLDMVRQLCELHDVSYEKRAGKSLVSALAGTSLASIGASFVKAIPGVGSLLGGVSMSLMSGASTYALGIVFQIHFARGGNLDNLSVEDFKSLYKEKVEEGKKKAKEWKAEEDREKRSGTISREKMLQELEKLSLLKNQGVINEAEYNSMRQKVLDSFIG
jgi:uncharacterized protein (DUF697 family)